jgi:dienelactone hydrolase
MLKTLRMLAIGFACLGSAFTHAAIQTKEVTYKAGDTILKGFVAWDDSIKGKTPGVLVAHEFWGLNDYARTRAKQIAQLGYTALALDMYGDGKWSDHPKEAGEMFNAVMGDAPLRAARFNAALEALKQQPTVDADRVGAIGYCMGGAVVLQGARSGADLDVVASFHGALGTKERAKKGDVKGKVLVFHGEADSFVTPEQVTALKQEMKDAGVDFTYVGYPGVKHSFTNPHADKVAKDFGMDVGYDTKADADSWAKLQPALKAAFAK